MQKFVINKYKTIYASNRAAAIVIYKRLQKQGVV